MKSTHVLFIKLSIIAGVFIPIASAIDFMNKNYVALAINCTAVTLIIANLLFAKGVKDLQKIYISFVALVYLLLFSQQLITPYYAIHNYIFLTILPLVSASLLGLRSSTAFNLACATLVMSANHISKAIGIEAAQQTTYISTDVLDAIAVLVVTLVTSMLAKSVFKELNARNISLRLNARENEYLISVLTHDISNQITVINLAKNKIRKKAGEGCIEGALNKIDTRTGNIERIINKIRNTQMAGRMDYQMSTISIIDIFEDIVVRFDEKIREKKVKIDFKYDPNQSYLTTADKTILLNSVIFPLINSGLELAEEGQTISLTLDVAPKSTRLIIAGDSYKLFSSTVLSNIKTGTIQEKEATLSVVSAKRVLDKFDAKLEIHPPTRSGEVPNIQIIFSKELARH